MEDEVIAVVNKTIDLFRKEGLTVEEAESVLERLTQAIQCIKQNNKV
jgi:hypothetical protein